jgi:cation diffusion facilitator CzcD-associated flavoprotein CzcO
VIGGGQAGLAIGYFLAQRGRDFTILEAAAQPAAAWRERWDSLKLFTPARYDALPGLPFPGDPDRYPGRDDVVAYLPECARHFELPVELDTAHARLGPDRLGGGRRRVHRATDQHAPADRAGGEPAARARRVNHRRET